MSNANGIPPEVQAAINVALAAQASVYEATIARLESRFSNMSIPKQPAVLETPPKRTKSTIPLNRHGSEPPPSRLKSTSRTLPSPSPLSKSNSATKPLPTSHQTPPPRPARKRPHQVQLRDYPKVFEGTKASQRFLTIPASSTLTLCISNPIGRSQRAHQIDVGHD